MPRRTLVSKRRVVEPDWVYRSPLVGLLLNHLQRRGKKTIASKVMYEAFDIIGEWTHEDPLKVFEQSVKNLRPEFGFSTTKRGRSVWYRVFRLRAYRGISLCLRWMVDSARERSGHCMSRKLALEIIATAKNSSPSFKKRRALYAVVRSHIHRCRKRKGKK
jgi:small subunit ribosomal protein S7